MKDAVQFLAVSESADTCNLIQRSIKSEGCNALCVGSPAEALRLLDGGLTVDFLLIDGAPSSSGCCLFDPTLLRSVDSEKLCILSSAGDDAWRDQAAMWDITVVLTLASVGREARQLANGLERSASRMQGAHAPITRVPHYHLEELDGNRFFLAASPTMMKLYRDIRTLAPVDIPVLILGESGVGKENVALLLHKYHRQPDKKLLNINCAALPNELLESELFGYEAGAFTGATKSKPGMFELANKSTLLLDEIGEMSPQMQAKLLHVLQDGSFCRLGARSASQVDVRVLAATNINMQEAIAEKRFREDLYYRLNTLTITVPPLRERLDEIPLLMRELFQRLALELHQPFICPERMIEAAQHYHWPGNLRELRNVVTRTLILRDEEAACKYLQSRAKASVSPAPPESMKDSSTLRTTAASGMKDAVKSVKSETEVRMLQDALSASGWNRRRAASNLNISYRTMLYKIQQHGLRA